MEEINWKYLAGGSCNNGRSFHRMYNSFVNGIEVRKEANSKTTWYYIKEEEGEYTDEKEFLKALEEKESC